MPWSPDIWEQRLAILIDDCAEKVLQEMEKEISERLRSLSRNYILEILPTALANAGIQTISAGAGNNGLEEKNEGNQKPAYSGLGCSGSGETAAAGVQAEAEGAGGELNDQQAGNGLIDAERTESLWYALAIISVPVDLPEITGIEDSPCRLIEAENLGMIVCPVPQSEYDQEALHRNMEDLAWVEGHARCHEVILLRLMEEIPVIPMPFCTLFLNETQVRQQLSTNGQFINQELDRLGNCREMYLKLFINKEQLKAKLTQGLSQNFGKGGMSYLQKRRWEKNIDERMTEVCDEYGETLYQTLKEIAQATCLLERSTVEEPEGLHLVFAARFLLAKEHNSNWDEKILSFDRLADPWGFLMDVSGPWPTYHFAGLNGEEAGDGGNCDFQAS